MRPSVQHFFFSSRRRHTRLVSDWSSDVCSSDLTDSPVTEGDSKPQLQVNDTAAQAPDNQPERSEEHTSELQSLTNLVCRLLLEKKKTKKKKKHKQIHTHT